MWHSILLGVSTIYLHYTGEQSLSYLCTCFLSVLCCGLMQGKHTSVSTENEEEQYTSKRLTCHHGSVLDQLLGKRFRRCSQLLFTYATIWVIDLQKSNRTIVSASEKAEEVFLKWISWLSICKCQQGALQEGETMWNYELWAKYTTTVTCSSLFLCGHLTALFATLKILNSL